MKGKGICCVKMNAGGKKGVCVWFGGNLGVLGVFCWGGCGRRAERGSFFFFFFFSLSLFSSREKRLFTQSPNPTPNRTQTENITTKQTKTKRKKKRGEKTTITGGREERECIV